MSLCFKCHAARGRLVSRDGVSKLYCEACFVSFCRRTLRDGVLMRCRVPCDEPVAVAVSGGVRSLTLLRELGELQRASSRAGGVRFVFLPFHLDESALLLPTTTLQPQQQQQPMQQSSGASHTKDDDDMRAHFALLRSLAVEQPTTWCAETHTRTQTSSLQQQQQPLFAPGSVRVFGYDDVLTPRAMALLRRCLHGRDDGVRTRVVALDDRVALYACVRRHALCAAARRVVCEWRRAHEVDGTSSSSSWVHMLLGDDVVGSAVMALTALLEGGGSTRAVHLSASRGVAHNVVLLRPLRALLPKEVVQYARLHDVRHTYTPTLATYRGTRTLRGTLEGFLHTLQQRGYRTMLYNVIAVVNKMTVRPAEAEAVVRGVHHTPPSPRTAATTLNTAAAMTKGNRVVLSRAAAHYRDALHHMSPPHFAYACCCCVVCGCPLAAAAAADAAAAAVWPCTHVAVDNDVTSRTTAAAEQQQQQPAHCMRCDDGDTHACHVLSWCNACDATVRSVAVALAAAADGTVADTTSAALSQLLCALHSITTHDAATHVAADDKDTMSSSTAD